LLFKCGSNERIGSSQSLHDHGNQTERGLASGDRKSSFHLPVSRQQMKEDAVFEHGHLGLTDDLLNNHVLSNGSQSIVDEVIDHIPLLVLSIQYAGSMNVKILITANHDFKLKFKDLKIYLCTKKSTVVRRHDSVRKLDGNCFSNPNVDRTNCFTILDVSTFGLINSIIRILSLFNCHYHHHYLLTSSFGLIGTFEHIQHSILISSDIRKQFELNRNF
jgi:hypothetical protein